MEFAKIIWEKNTPKSVSFDDFYFQQRLVSKRVYIIS